MWTRRAMMRGVLLASSVEPRRPAPAADVVERWSQTRDRVMITFERVRDAHEPCLNEFLLDTHHAYTLMVDHTLQESYDLVRIEELRIDMLRRLDVWRTMEDPVYYKNSEAIHDVWSSLALDIEMYVDSIPDETI